jgi:hypothetical protein
MTPQQIIGVAVRLYAIWLVLLALQTSSTGIELHLQPNSGDTISIYLFSVIYVLVAALLWRFPMAVAHSLVPRTNYDDVLGIPVQQVTVAATVILGLWLFAFRALPAISFYATFGAYWISKGQPLSSLPANQHIAFIVGTIELVVALLLVFRAPSLSAFILTKHREHKGE